MDRRSTREDVCKLVVYRDLLILQKTLDIIKLSNCGLVRGIRDAASGTFANIWEYSYDE
jgi:hypothetical protein